MRFSGRLKMEFIFLERPNIQLKILLGIFIVLAVILQDVLKKYHSRHYNSKVHGRRMVKAVTKVSSAKRAATKFQFHARTKSQQSCCLVVVGHIFHPKGWGGTMKMRNHLLLGRNFSAKRNQPHWNLRQRGHKSIPSWYKCVNFQWMIKLNTSRTTLPVYSSMIFSVSDELFEWSLVFNPHSVVLTVKHLVQEMTISSQGFPLPACSLL